VGFAGAEKIEMLMGMYRVWFFLLVFIVRQHYALRMSTSSPRWTMSQNQHKQQNSGGGGSAPQVEIKLVSFNILAPCYHKVKPEVSPPVRHTSHGGEADLAQAPPVKILESEVEALYLKRNAAICEQLLSRDADIICVQEFWAASEPLRKLFRDTLCTPEAGYTLKELRRTAHWRKRSDGLAMFVKESRLVLQDSRDILFHDCGDRVAQLLLLAVRPPPDSSISYPPQQFLCVNTHLLFPHNGYSTNIRLREMTKVLGFVESFRQRELCSDVCGRATVRIPVIIAGDFNGSPKGVVYNYVRSQNYKSAMEETWGGGKDKSRWDNWISHRSHKKEIVGVDHVFFLNPSDQTEERLPPVPDWTDLVFRELMQQIVEKGYGGNSMQDVFAAFDEDASKTITREEFAATLSKLGFQREGEPALTKEEIDILVDSADTNGDGTIDFKEFCNRFQAAESRDGQMGQRPLRQNAINRIPFSQSSWLIDKLPSMVSDEGNDSIESGFGMIASPSTSSSSSSSSSSASAVATAAASASQAGRGAVTLATAAAATSDLKNLDFAVLSQWMPDARPLGNLRVKSVRIWPEELEMGVWPKDYSLSDHGLIECIFVGEALQN